MCGELQTKKRTNSGKKRMTEREKMFSVPEIKGRGWTDTAIRQFLPEKPDTTRPNPHHSQAGAPMKFWLRRRVVRVEKTKRFQAWRAGVAARQGASAKAVETREKNIVAKMLEKI